MSLIELLVVMVVVGILAAIAYPSYRQYVVRTNRTDAKAALEQGRQVLERCFTRFNAYDAADCEVDFDPPVLLASGTYQISAELEAGTFVLTATPQGAQAADDARCGNFTLNELGQRGVSGTDTAAQCWGR
jgi:type IV pilus assembly protein PilE